MFKFGKYGKIKNYMFKPVQYQVFPKSVYFLKFY